MGGRQGRSLGVLGQSFDGKPRFRGRRGIDFDGQPSPLDIGVIELRRVEWFLAGFLRYAFQFRFHTFFVTGHNVCFSSTPLLSCLPFLGQHYPPSSVLRRHPTPCQACVFLALLSLVQHTLFPLRDPARSPGLLSIPNIQHAMLSDPGEAGKRLPIALTPVDFRKEVLGKDFL